MCQKWMLSDSPSPRSSEKAGAFVLHPTAAPIPTNLPGMSKTMIIALLAYIYLHSCQHLMIELVFQKTKALFYVSGVLNEKEDYQRSGLVVITVNTGPADPGFVNNVAGTSTLMRISPVRLASYHFIYDDPGYESVIKAILRTHTESREKVRMKVHKGSVAQTKLELSSVGIPVDVLPFNEKGDLVLEYHERWLERRWEKEHRLLVEEKSEKSLDVSGSDENSTSADQVHILSTYTDSDILPGSNRAAISHPGNILYRFEMVEIYEEYEATSWAEKKKVVQRFVDNVHQRGGRFLQKYQCSSSSEEMWTVMSSKEACAKVAMGMRDRRKVMKTKMKKDQRDESI